jgi:adenylate cyclase
MLYLCNTKDSGLNEGTFQGVRWSKRRYSSLPSEIRQVIENSHLFSGLEPGLMDDIAASAAKRTLGAGEMLFQKGDRADALWGVLSGRVVIEVRADDGKEMVLHVFEAGDIFGEVGVLDFGPRRVAATVACKSELFRLERAHFLEHLHTSPELCFRVFSLLCSHLRDTTESLEDTALYKLPNRLAKRLTLMADEAAVDDGHAVLKVVQSDLARMLGVQRESINRQLREWEKSGWVSIQRERIEILERKTLTDLAAPGQIADHNHWGNENLSGLAPVAFPAHSVLATSTDLPERRFASILAVDCAGYAGMLMTDSANTIRRIKAGLAATDRAIKDHGGRVIWSTGDRTLAEFPDSPAAVAAALEIQSNAGETGPDIAGQADPIFRIGIHCGDVLASDGWFIGDPVNVAIRLTELSDSGGICFTGEVRDALEESGNLELQYLGKHELKDVTSPVSVFSARSLPWLKRMALWADALVPRHNRLAAATAAAMVVAGGIWFAGDWMARQTVSLAVSPLSIAVLPFASGGDPALSYLADGIPEYIRTALSRIPGMRVISRESSGYFNERTASVEEMGRTLQVAWLLRGSFETANDEIHATAQLLNAVTSELVWEHQFRESQGDSIRLGQDIVHEISVSLGITDDNGAGLPLLLPLTTNPEAHELYLQAQSHIWRGRQRNYINAIPLLKKAVELDPSFAEAHAILADLYLRTELLDIQAAYNPSLRQELARKSLQEALSLKPDSPLVLAKAAVALEFENDEEGARSLAERALRIDPNNTEALWARYWVESAQQDWRGALQTSERLMRLEPMSVNALYVHYYQLQFADRHQQALSIANRVLALYPESDVPQAHAWAAASKLELGDRLGAIESSRKGIPYGVPLDLWTGLEYDWEFFDDLDPIRSADPLVYIEQYDQIRQLLIDYYDAVEPDSTWANSHLGLNGLDYLVNRGALEVLAGDFETSVEFFERARLLASDEEGGLVRARIQLQLLQLSRQSHWSLALLFAYRKSGRHEKADIIAEQFEDLVAGHIESIATISDRADYNYLYMQAQYYAIEGRTAEALDKLRTWLDYGVYIFTYIKWDPFLESLRGDPEFESIVAEVEVG